MYLGALKGFLFLSATLAKLKCVGGKQGGFFSREETSLGKGVDKFSSGQGFGLAHFSPFHPHLRTAEKKLESSKPLES